MLVLFSHYDIDRRELLNIRPFEQRNIPSIDPRRVVPTSYTCCHYFIVRKLKMKLFVISLKWRTFVNKVINVRIICAHLSKFNLIKINSYVHILMYLKRKFQKSCQSV